MYHSVIKFGDIYRKQISGTIMGTPCAPPWATLFQGLDERDNIIPRFQVLLPIFVRYLDDIFGIWVPLSDNQQANDAQWNEFTTTTVNTGCLEWEFSELSKTVNFLDMSPTTNSLPLCTKNQWHYISSSRRTHHILLASRQATLLVRYYVSIAFAPSQTMSPRESVLTSVARYTVAIN